MSLLVREALVNCSYARADEHFVLSLARLRHLGIDTGRAACRIFGWFSFCNHDLLVK